MRLSGSQAVEVVRLSDQVSGGGEGLEYLPSEVIRLPLLSEPFCNISCIYNGQRSVTVIPYMRRSIRFRNIIVPFV